MDRPALKACSRRRLERTQACRRGSLRRSGLRTDFGVVEFEVGGLLNYWLCLSISDKFSYLPSGQVPVWILSQLLGTRESQMVASANKNALCEIKSGAGWKLIAVVEALSLGKGETFRCPECHGRVSPHKEGGNTPAHFEHLPVHHGCSHASGFDGRPRHHPTPID